jgi:hypothetical protein
MLPTFAMNTKTSIFLLLNGATNYKASPTEIYCYIGGNTVGACNLNFYSRLDVGAWIEQVCTLYYMMLG